MNNCPKCGSEKISIRIQKSKIQEKSGITCKDCKYTASGGKLSEVCKEWGK